MTNVRRIVHVFVCLTLLSLSRSFAESEVPDSTRLESKVVDSKITVRQLTSGPKHHFFGYIGHVRTIPWNASGRYLLTLQTVFQDRMPAAGDAADILLLDARENYAARVVERTLAWNFQQGTMLYWNPGAAETQFFFNDRDPKSNRIFTVCCDVSTDQPRRHHEYRFDDVAVANGGVAPNGDRFAAINYGRLARLRPVTGYPATEDVTAGVNCPSNDGVFVVDVESGVRKLLVSYRQLADVIRPLRPDVDSLPLFINHTLWSPDGARLFFFCRGEFESKEKRLDLPFVVRSDGRGLTLLKHHFGGHPEWLNADQMIGKWEKRQGVYDVQRQQFVRALGKADTFPDPGGDIALSSDGQWLVNGSSKGAENQFTFCRLADGVTLRAGPLDRGRWRSGELRIDAAPCWNRTATAVLTTAVANDESRTRQLFLLELPAQQVSARPAGAVIANDAATSSRKFEALDLSAFQDGIKHWHDQFGRDRDDPRYEPEQIVEIAGNLIAYQNSDGGWPKNIDWLSAADPAEIKQVIGERRLRSTVDNRNTYSQIDYLSRAWQVTGMERFRQAAEKGLSYILKEQRPTGGWRGWDVDAITYNDDVMIGVMRLLRQVAAGRAPFEWVDTDRRVAAREALERAIAVTLKCQIVVDGQRTAWCQQHDHTTFEPVKARTYELPSRCPAETTTIVQFLMEIEQPSPDVVAAVDAAVDWLRQAELTGIRLERVKVDPVRFESHTAKWDIQVVKDPKAPPLWARFYEIATNQPFFANRDGRKVDSLAEVALERRSGYAWYGGWPRHLLETDYPKWQARLGRAGSK